MSEPITVKHSNTQRTYDIKRFHLLMHHSTLTNTESGPNCVL